MGGYGGLVWRTSWHGTIADVLTSGKMTDENLDDQWAIYSTQGQCVISCYFGWGMQLLSLEIRPSPPRKRMGPSCLCFAVLI